MCHICEGVERGVSYIADELEISGVLAYWTCETRERHGLVYGGQVLSNDETARTVTMKALMEATMVDDSMLGAEYIERIADEIRACTGPQDLMERLAPIILEMTEGDDEPDWKHSLPDPDEWKH